jgi:hypothetical protein
MVCGKGNGHDRDFMARLLIEKKSPNAVVEDVIEFRQGYQTLFYNFDHGLPSQ